MFVTVSHSHPSRMFVLKAVAYPSGATNGVSVRVGS
jgi:hypothetical protein